MPRNEQTIAAPTLLPTKKAVVAAMPYRSNPVAVVAAVEEIVRSPLTSRRRKRRALPSTATAAAAAASG